MTASTYEVRTRCKKFAVLRAGSYADFRNALLDSSELTENISTAGLMDGLTALRSLPWALYRALASPPNPYLPGMMVSEQRVAYEASPIPAVPPEQAQHRPRPYRWTVRQYHAMAEAGLIEEGARVELVAGQIVEMSPIGALHVGFTSHITTWLTLRFHERHTIIGQSPIDLDDENEPQPDVYLVPKRGDGYVTSLPTHEDAVLIVEVADSSIDYDTGDKAKDYARFGIPEYWVIDCRKREVHYFDAPAPAGYRRHLVLAEAEPLPSKLRGELAIVDLMPPVPTLKTAEEPGSKSA